MAIEFEWLQPFEAVFTGAADLDVGLVEPALGLGMRMERAAIDTPIELDVLVEDDGTVSLVGAPPTQHVETTYMPVFHHIDLVVTADGDGER
jgi:hypothetical protein